MLCTEQPQGNRTSSCRLALKLRSSTTALHACSMDNTLKSGMSGTSADLECVMQCKEKPQGDKYGFTSFALELCSGKGLDPLPSDSRRRGDRHALHVSEVHLALTTQTATKL